MSAMEEQTFAGILQDIVGSIREIIRLEIRLARAEITDSVSAMRSAALILAAGGLALFIALEVVVLAAVFALALVMPAWAAALVVGIAVAVIGAGCVMAGAKRLTHVQPPKRTIASVQENLSWPTTQTR